MMFKIIKQWKNTSCIFLKSSENLGFKSGRMGLMTEPAWDSNPGSMSKTDFHHENLRNLKKIQARAKHRPTVDSRSRQPVKAFAIPETSSNKKYSPVQPRLYDWTQNGHGPDPPGLHNGTSHADMNGRTSPNVSRKQNYSHVQSRVHEWSVQPPPEPSEHGSKAFLKGHQKTGPFLPSSGGSVLGMRRINGLRSVRDYGGNDFDNVDDDIHVAMASPAGTRFSEVTIDERKRRINNLVAEIYSVTPLCKENVTHKTVERNLRRVASCEQVII